MKAIGLALLLIFGFLVFIIVLSPLIIEDDMPDDEDREDDV